MRLFLFLVEENLGYRTAHSPEITEQRLLLNQKFKRLEYLEFHAQHFQCYNSRF